MDDIKFVDIAAEYLNDRPDMVKLIKDRLDRVTGKDWNVYVKESLVWNWGDSLDWFDEVEKIENFANT